MPPDPPLLRRLRAPRARVILALLTIVAAAVFASTALWVVLDPRPSPDEFNLNAWETRHFPEKWLYAIGELTRADRSLEEQNADIARFLMLNRQIDSLEQRLSDATAREQATDELALQLNAARHERERLENAVEASIEGRITAAAESEGLRRGLGPLPDMVWPPVDLEFTTPPRTLAISSRDRIELRDTILLNEGLSLQQVEALEAERQKRYGESALAITAAGVGAYPTLIAYPSSYSGMLEVAAHEWTHNYLSFRPLGVRYFASNDLRTMNETVADIVGTELGRYVVARWPLDPQPQTSAPAPPRSAAAGEASTSPGAAIDLRAELRELRSQVEILLGDGRIDEAERVMEERRRYFVDNGYYIRKINQAYFAFTNLYAGEAGSPGATNPIGPKLDELRRLSGSLSAFLAVAGDLRSLADLDRALDAARAAP